MEIYERIRFLRKNELKLSQSEFGKRLGVSRDVIKNIELNLLAKPEQKLSLIKLMCKEFDVNEDWLLNGVEPMFVDSNTFSLDKFLQEKDATELEIDIIKIYMNLDKNVRKKLMSDLKKAVLKDNELAATTESEENTPKYKDMSVDELLTKANKAQKEADKWETLLEKKQQMLLASQKQNENWKENA